jgi:molybdenum cofactor cytidylyltransferase
VNVAAVILAAGSSSRLGTPKQLLQFEGTSLLRRAALAASGSRAAEVIVLLGSDASAMMKELKGLRVRTVKNSLWREGIGSSIRRAVSALGSGCDGVLILLCDQPRLTSAHLDSLLDAFALRPDRPAASKYGGVAGVPALFPRAMFGELLSLTGDSGAKRVLAACGDNLSLLPWPDGAYDVDTATDVFSHL